MTKAELNLWTEYKKGITERNAKGAEENRIRNNELREKHYELQRQFNEQSKMRAEFWSKERGYTIPHMPIFSMSPYFIFIGGQATYEGFLDYLAEQSPTA